MVMATMTKAEQSSRNVARLRKMLDSMEDVFQVSDDPAQLRAKISEAADKDSATDAAIRTLLMMACAVASEEGNTLGMLALSAHGLDEMLSGAKLILAAEALGMTKSAH